MWSSLGSHWPITTLFSSGVEEKRWKWSRSMFTIWAASRNAFSTSPYSNTPFQTLLVPALSCRMLSSLSACSASTTGSSPSYSTWTNSEASSARLGDSASTAATGSPWYLTLSTASGKSRILAQGSGPISMNGWVSGSICLPVSVPATPGNPSAREVSTLRMRAWA